MADGHSTQGCEDRRKLQAHGHTTPSNARSGLLVAPWPASQLKRGNRLAVSDCSKSLRQPGPQQDGPSIEKPSLRAGLQQGG